MAVMIVDKVLGVKLRNEIGDFHAGAYTTVTDSKYISEHILLYKQLDPKPCPVRINSACYTGDLFGCQRCDCSWQLREAMKRINALNHGLIIYHLDHEGRANGAVAKLRVYGHTDSSGIRSKEAYATHGGKPDARDYRVSAAILKDLDITTIRLISNNPAKRQALESEGITVQACESLVCNEGHLNEYYDWKRTDLGHLI